MDWLRDLDVTVFRFLNGKLVNPIFDYVMPFLSGNVFFYPALIVLSAFVIWKFRGRAVVFLLLLTLAVGLTDGAICRTIKHAIGRERPFVSLADARCLLGQGGSGSMPSSHAANWFAASMVAFVFFRRSIWIMVPLACAVSFSRVYCGVHYPSDVVAGAILGAGTAAATLSLTNQLWLWIGRKWFPLWWRQFPSLLSPPKPSQEEAEEEEPRFAPRLKPGQRPAESPVPRHVTVDEQWLRLGYLVLGLLLVARLLYVASDVIQLSPQEAVQWLRSKYLHELRFTDSWIGVVLALPGTLAFGDTQLGVRFFAPVQAAGISLLLLRLFAKNANARAGFFLVLFTTATPLLAAGSILVHPDFICAFFWAAAMIAGWQAVQPNGKTASWILVGILAGLVSLSKSAVALVPLVSFLLVFILWAPARKQFRTPGPYLAVLIYLGCAALTLFAREIFAAQALRHWFERERSHHYGLLLLSFNPIWLIFTLWAAVAFWRRNRHNPFLLYCFCMSVPGLLLLFALGDAWSGMAMPGIPLLSLMTTYWDTQWRLRPVQLKPWLSLGLVLGLGATLLAHQTDWVTKLTGHALPIQVDPLAGVRGWNDTAQFVHVARRELTTEGKSVFIIAQTEGLAAEISFYLPEAKAAVKANPFIFTFFEDTNFPAQSLVYSAHKGENAIFAAELRGEDSRAAAAAELLRRQFESVADLGVKNVMYHGQLLRRLQLFACRNLQ